MKASLGRGWVPRSGRQGGRAQQTDERPHAVSKRTGKVGSRPPGHTLGDSGRLPHPLCQTLQTRRVNIPGAWLQALASLPHVLTVFAGYVTGAQ